jgi:hypothetical protein
MSASRYRYPIVANPPDLSLLWDDRLSIYGQLD